MDTPQITKEAIRAAMQALGQDGKEITYRLVYEALGLENEAQQAIVRSRISDMRRHGEVTRLAPGYFAYNFEHRPREARTYAVMWRYVRAAKPGWTISECAMMTRVSYTRALRYCNWLQEEGYIERQGKDARQATTWRATLKANQSPETPYPPLREPDPYAKERSAAATITRLLLCSDPHSRHTARRIVDAAHILLARFERQANTVTEVENA